jgi:hypothetical protein
MHSYEAVDRLSRMRSLVSQPTWVASVVKALRPDSDPQLRELCEEDKERLLEMLIEQPVGRVAPHVAELVSIALSYLPERAYKAWQVGDVLASLGFYGQAKDIAVKVADSMPDTVANRPYRLQTQQVLAVFEAEAGAASGDEAGLSEALTRWESINRAIASDAEENEHARRPFSPAFLSE